MLLRNVMYIILPTLRISSLGLHVHVQRLHERIHMDLLSLTRSCPRDRYLTVSTGIQGGKKHQHEGQMTWVDLEGYGKEGIKEEKYQMH